jgi:hypothetical protein
MVLPEIAILFEWDAAEKWWSYRDTKASKGENGFARSDDPLAWLSSGEVNEPDYDPLGTSGRLVVGWNFFEGLSVWGFTEPKNASRDWFAADLPIGDGLFQFVRSKGPTGLLYFTGCYGDAKKQVVEVLSSFIGTTLAMPD